jgi:hypothetical protein
MTERGSPLFELARVLVRFNRVNYWEIIADNLNSLNEARL